jgi:D-tyrosyl-tRNA(Tyr) deacylase
MKLLIQRVHSANVKVENKVIGAINNGYLIYVCFEQNDNNDILNKAIEKVINLRIFEDEAGKMNRNIMQAKGEILSISQFTLSWDGKKGNRPSFDTSMSPANAQLYYHKFNEALKQKGIVVKKGTFGAHMMIESINDGPVTFHLSF